MLWQISVRLHIEDKICVIDNQVNFSLSQVDKNRIRERSFDKFLSVSSISKRGAKTNDFRLTEIVNLDMLLASQTQVLR